MTLLSLVCGCIARSTHFGTPVGIGIVLGLGLKENAFVFDWLSACPGGALERVSRKSGSSQFNRKFDGPICFQSRGCM